MFVGARFLIGFGVAIAHGSSPLLITELVHPQHRAIYTAIYNTMWYIGSFIAAWLTFGTNKIAGNWAWRAPSLVQIFPSALQLIFICMSRHHLLRKSERCTDWSQGSYQSHLDGLFPKARTRKPSRSSPMFMHRATSKMKWFSWNTLRFARP
jgi:MFS family permease